MCYPYTVFGLRHIDLGHSATFMDPVSSDMFISRLLSIYFIFFSVDILLIPALSAPPTSIWKEPFDRMQLQL